MTWLIFVVAIIGIIAITATAIGQMRGLASDIQEHYEGTKDGEG